jgi:O-succinylbenzoate synthase
MVVVDGSGELSRRWSAIGDRSGGSDRGVILEGADLWLIELPFIEAVVTARGVHRRRPLVLVQLHGRTEAGPVEGWGECAALEDSTFDSEDAYTAYTNLGDHLLPALLRQISANGGWVPSPANLTAITMPRPTPLAFSALEMAVADLHLRSEDRSLASLLGVEGSTVALGAVVGAHEETDALVQEVGRRVAEGFTRVKMKIGPRWDLEPVAAVRRMAPDLVLQVDANGSYGPDDLGRLRELDRFGLACLEQPFDRRELDLHVRLANLIETPVCLDESLDSPIAVRTALDMGACSVVCVKPSRLGGIGAALEVIEACASAGTPLWMGGMYESGYARAVITTLAALPGFSWPGDLGPSRTYLGEDLVPELALRHGFEDRSFPGGVLRSGLPDRTGMGPAPDRATVERTSVRHLHLTAAQE